MKTRKLIKGLLCKRLLEYHEKKYLYYAKYFLGKEVKIVTLSIK